MPTVTDAQHSQLGAIARKQRETRAELRSLAGRTDPGAVQRVNALRTHLDKLQEREAKLTAAIERQEATMRAHGVRDEQMSLARMLQAQGIRVDTSHIGAATRDDDGGGLVATDISFEGGADEKDSPLARATSKPNVNVNVAADLFDTDVFALASPELRSRALSAVEHQAVRQDVPVAESGAERLQDALRAAEDHTPDLDVLARYLLVTGSPAYERAFAKVIRGSRDNSGPSEFTDQEQAAWIGGKRVQRSLTLGSAIGSGGEGAGLLAPFIFDPSLIFVGTTVADPIRSLARVVSGAAPEWRGVSGGNIVSAWLSELQEFPDAAEDLNQPVIRAEKHGTDVIVSWEALQDVRTIIPILRDLFAQRKAQVESDAWINGAGPTATPPEPEGIVTALDGTTREIAPTTAESFTLPDIAKLYKSVGPAYRANASWLINVDTYLKARTFVSEADASNAKVFNSDESRLLGKRWFEASSVDSFDDLDSGATADNYLAIFGDVRAGFTIYDRIGTTVVPYVAIGSNRRTIGGDHIAMYWRVGSGVTNPNALAMLSVPTAA